MARNTTSKGTSSRSRKPKPASDDTAPQTTGTTNTPAPQDEPASPAAPKTTRARPSTAATSSDAKPPAKGADTAKPATVVDAAAPDSAAPAQSEPVAGAEKPATATDTKPAADMDAAPPASVDAQASGASEPDQPSAQDEPAMASADAPQQTPSGPDASHTPQNDPAPTPAGAKSGFMPMFLGGVLAGALGYGAHYLIADQSVDRAELSAIQAELGALRQDMPVVPDMAPLQAQLAELRDDLAALDRTDAPSGGDIAALQGQFDTLADDVQQAQGQLQADMAQVQADLADLRDLAENRVRVAEAAVDTALAQSGLDSIRAALETGQPFGDAVARVAQGGFDVPDVLRDNAATGIATLEQLQERFPSAARDAVRASLGDAPADGPAERVVNFLRAQTGARSTVPRDGDDPDAIMSRAAAAVEAGDLQTALSIIDDMPDAGRAAMSDWQAAAEAHEQAVAQTDILAQMIPKE